MIVAINKLIQTYRARSVHSALNISSSFVVASPRRLTQMIMLAVLAHLFLLLMLDFQPKSLFPLKKMRSTKVLEVTLTPPPSSLAKEKTVSPESMNSLHKNNLVTIHQAPSLGTSSPIKSAAKGQKRTISAAAHESKDAAYLARWQSYIEQFGNTHYPEFALKNNVRGDLRLLVAIQQDGSLHEVSLRQSSGSAVLDQAAINIVLQAAPFEPLPAEIAAEVEILEIIRTWQFRGKLSTS